MGRDESLLNRTGGVCVAQTDSLAVIGASDGVMSLDVLGGEVHVPPQWTDLVCISVIYMPVGLVLVRIAGDELKKRKAHLCNDVLGVRDQIMTRLGVVTDFGVGAG